MNSPSEILRQVLISNGLVIMPGVPAQTIPPLQFPYDGTTQCFVSDLPDDVDQVVFIRGVMGKLFGRLQRGGKTEIHYGVLVNVRALDYPMGYALSIAVARAMDAFTARVVTVDGTGYPVQSIYRQSSVMELGEEVGKKRQLFSISARIAMQDQQPVLG